jgi:hypothetical protein
MFAWISDFIGYSQPVSAHADSDTIPGSIGSSDKTIVRPPTPGPLAADNSTPETAVETVRPLSPVQAMEEGKASALETTVCPATQSAPNHITLEVRPDILILVGGNWSIAHRIKGMIPRAELLSMNDYMKRDPTLAELRRKDIVILAYETVWGEPPQDATWFIRQLQSFRLQGKTETLDGPLFFSIEFHMTNEPPTLGKLVSALGGHGQHWTQTPTSSVMLWVEALEKLINHQVYVL